MQTSSAVHFREHFFLTLFLFFQFVGHHQRSKTGRVSMETLRYQTLPPSSLYIYCVCWFLINVVKMFSVCVCVQNLPKVLVNPISDLPDLK